MAVTKRVRTDLQVEQDIEAFAARAEQPMSSGPEKPLVTVTEKSLASVPDIAESEPLPSPTAPEAAPEAIEAAPAAAAAPAAPAAPTRKTARAGSSAPVPVVADWKRRNREPKTTGMNLRASPSQLDLLRSASLAEEISQQKVLERLIWPILEEKYGFKAPE